jgi:hypothetical protein
MTSQELNAYLAERVTEEDREDLTKAQHLYVLLGLMEPEVDLTEMFLALLGEQVLGLFDPADESLYVISETSDIGVYEELTLAHEYTHALQHQHFDLNQLSERHEADENSDAGAAVTALVEGDATLTEFVYGSRRFTLREIEDAVGRDRPSTVYDNAPAVVRKILVFPYSEGFSFVQALYISEGYKPVDAAFMNPPQSTEQILHPSMYREGHGPVAVALAANEAMLSGGWQVEDEDTMGEFFLKTWLEEEMTPEEASTASAGWGGDRYHMFRDESGRNALGAVTVWDTEGDAAEFAEALERYVDGGLAAGVVGRVEHAGSEVRLGVAPDENTLSLLIDGLSTAS